MIASKKVLGIAFLGHGSLDSEAESEMNHLCLKVQGIQPGFHCLPAWLNRAPFLVDAFLQFQLLGCTHIKILPLLVFQGKHMRHDFPELLEQMRKKFPEIKIQGFSHLAKTEGFINWLTYSILDTETVD